MECYHGRCYFWPKFLPFLCFLLVVLVALWLSKMGKERCQQRSSVWTSSAPAIQMESFSRIASSLPIQILGNFPSFFYLTQPLFWRDFSHSISLQKSFNTLNCAVNKDWCVQGVWNGATWAVQAHQHSGLPFESLLMISEDNFLWLRHFHGSREGTTQEILLFTY